MTKIAITGHIDIFENNHDDILDKLKDKIQELKANYPKATFIVGQAEGADQLARKVIEELGYVPTLLDTCEEEGSDLQTSQFYNAQADQIVSSCDHLIAVWDGVFSYKTGGTSDIVGRAIKSDRPIEIHHLVTPREQNPYPIHSLNEDVIDFRNGKFNRIPIAINFSWISFKNAAHNLKKTKKRSTWSFLKSDLCVRFFLPLILVSVTFTLGLIGFYASEEDPILLDNIFQAAKLLSLGSSIFGNKIDFFSFLNIARFLGLIFLVYAFIYGLYLALGDRRTLLKLRNWQQLKNFNIVIGLNLESKYLINDLSETHNENVVLLYQDDNDSFLEEMKSNDRVITIKGNLTSRNTLAKLLPNQARNIYILTDQDDINLRCAQELDSLGRKWSHDRPVDQFVRIENSFKRKFLHDSLSINSAARTNIFNFNTNIIRRLLLLFPIARFHQTKEVDTAQVVILGFNQLGEELLLTLLKQGHYTIDKFLDIDVICDNAQENEDAFLEKYPTLKNINTDGKDIIEDYTWSNINFRFHEKENAPQYWLKKTNPIYKNIDKKSILTIYSTTEEAVQSAAFVNIFLPKLNILKDKDCNLQMYVHYNLPDKKETQIIERYFNKLAPRIPVKCFGNYTDECNQNAVHNMALDALPKIINASYSNIDIENAKSVNEAWNMRNEKDKDSSRQAADHLWVKLRVLWFDIKDKFDAKNFEPNAELKETMSRNKFKQIFSEFEHRRWCAELLLRGYRPVTEDTQSDLYKEVSENWDNPNLKAEKQKYINLFQHVDLVPYKDLHKKEADKDLKQLDNIPKYLRALIWT